MTETDFAPWLDAYLVRISCLDQEHKNSLSQVNEIASAITKNKDPKELESLFKKLFDHYKEHCAHEERLLSAHNYPGLEKQRNDHADWLKELESMHSRISQGDLPLSMELLTQIRDWLTEHILGADKAYAEFLADHGVR